MRYSEYQSCRRELLALRHRAATVEGVEKIDREIDALESAHARDYDLSDRMRIRVRVLLANMGVSMALHQLDGERRVHCYVVEFYHMTPEEIRLTADIRQVADQYIAGMIDALPPSGKWPPGQAPGGIG